MTDPERDELRDAIKAALEESRRRVRENREENRRAHLQVLADRARRSEEDRRKVEAVLARLCMGGPSATQSAICSEHRVSPKRVVRLRALVEAKRRGPAG